MAGDAYLVLAEQVLEASRMPLSSREIIQRAYLMNLVPKHLHGRTQHKTLTARISEDILKNRNKSIFFRPYPGRYFLSKFIDDDTFPDEYRNPIITRRRSRQLNKEYAAYLPSGYPIILDEWGCFPKGQFSKIVRSNDISYARNGLPSDQAIPIWHLSCVKREREILAYTRGRYLDGREEVTHGKTVGFTAPLTHNDRTLFEQTYHGVLGAAVSIVAIDLNLEHSVAFQKIEAQSTIRGGFLDDSTGRMAAVIVCQIEIPRGFHIETNRLAIKNLDWVSMDEFRRRIYNYDQWSQMASFLIR